jgi:predicted amidohydrolase
MSTTEIITTIPNPENHGFVNLTMTPPPKLCTVAGCQIPVTRDIKKNITEIKKAIDWASDNEVDLLCTPECALSGYLWKPETVADPRVVETTQGLDELIAYSVDKKVDLILGTAFYNENNEWSNTQKFIIDGKVVHTHYKNLCFESEYTPGKGVSTILYKGITIAGLICNDYWANPLLVPEVGSLIHELKKQKVKIVFVSSNIPKEYCVKDCISNWTNATIEMYSISGNWTTIVCENPYLITGDPWSGKTVAQSGICSPGLDWIKSREHGTDYFLQTFY